MPTRKFDAADDWTVLLVVVVLVVENWCSTRVAWLLLEPAAAAGGTRTHWFVGGGWKRGHGTSGASMTMGRGGGWPMESATCCTACHSKV